LISLTRDAHGGAPGRVQKFRAEMLIHQSAGPPGRQMQLWALKCVQRSLEIPNEIMMLGAAVLLIS
jgi:hypothetical protein